MKALSAEWRVVAEFPGYEVSNYGALRRRDTGVELHPGKDRRGYPRVTFSDRGKKTYRYVHRLVAVAFLGEPPPCAIVCHINGDQADPRVTNLRYGSHKDNRQDAIRHGTAQRSRAHLTPEERREIRALAGTVSSRVLAERFNVTVDHARWVRRRIAA